MRVLLIGVLVVLALGQTQEQDKVDLGSLYDGPALNFDFYAGYIPVGNSNFYYWFTTSQNNPKTDPVVAFYNGGPGCSSISGSMTENGPFELDPSSNGTKLTLRPTSWNRLANMLWIESPAGVGFSYTNGHVINQTYATDDHDTAKNNRAVLEGFFQRFPQFNQHKFYISGESYAGTYIPTMTVELLSSPPASVPPLTGLMIGNPCTDELIDHNAFFQMVSTHDILPPTLSQQIISECPEDFRYIVDNSCCQFNYTDYPVQSASCKSALNQMYSLFANNNLYDLYSTCIGGAKGSAPCVANSFLNNFLNTDAVRQVVHAKLNSEIGPWYDCTPNLDYTSNYASIFKQVWPKIYELNANLDVMIYSGDADCCVPFFGTQHWTALLGGTVTDDWRPWQSEGQLAGYTIGYGGSGNGNKLRFTSLKGIGHMAPQFGPYVSFTMFQNYLNGNFPHSPVLRMANPVRPRA